MNHDDDLASQEPASREVIEPGGRWSRRLDAGDRLRIVDLEGQQAVDFLCYSDELPLDRLNVPNTVKLNRSLYVSKGTTIYSDRARKMFSVLEDTCGFHDTLAGCCSHEMDFLRYGVRNALSCRSNFVQELAKWSLGPSEIVTNINFFMRVTFDEQGAVEIAQSPSKAGDYVVLRAEMPVIAVLSNCPQQNNPSSGFRPTPIEVTVWHAVPPASNPRTE
jgi:urea carboxylase-associated protein 1